MQGQQQLLFGELHPGEVAYYSQIAVHKGWHAAAERAMMHLAKSGRLFSADDLRRLLEDGPQPDSMNAYGGLFLTWKARGLIRKVGYMPSRQRKRNGGAIGQWEGTEKASRMQAAY